jgi:acyl carrier protein
MNREALIRCIEVRLGSKNVKMEDRFFEDLGAESIDMLYILADIQAQTGIFVPEDLLPELTCVRDVYEYLINLPNGS